MSHPSQGGLRLPANSRGNRRVPLLSQGHFTGHIVAGDGAGVVVETESHLELNWCLCLLSREETSSLVEQVAFEWHDRDGEWHPHYFDMVVTQTDHRVIAYTVKPAARVTDEFMREIAWIAAQARSSGFASDIRLLSDTDLCPVELHNAQLLHGLRVSDPEADTAAVAVFNAMTGISTLADLSVRIGVNQHAKLTHLGGL